MRDVGTKIKEAQRKVDLELAPFAEGIKSMDESLQCFGVFKKAVADFRNRMPNTQALANVFVDTMLFHMSELREVYVPFVYLGLVESIGSLYVDFLVLLVVACGQDFHVESMQSNHILKHAVTFADLEEGKVALATRLAFLKNNGITTLLISALT